MIPEFSVELGNREQGTGKKDFSMYRVLYGYATQAIKNQIGVLYNNKLILSPTNTDKLHKIAGIMECGTRVPPEFGYGHLISP